MRGRETLLVALATLSSFSVACSKSAEQEGDVRDPSLGAKGPDEKETKTDGCDPTGDIPCFKGLAEPCRNYQTDFDGDEYCLEPPDPNVGIQLHIGPDDYSDPVQTDKYLIAPGDETNWSETKVMPNEATVFSRGYHSHMRPGSHHFIMFGVKDAPMGQTGPVKNAGGSESAAGAVGGTFLGGAGRRVQNIDTYGEYPEDQGIGTEMVARRPVAMNLHFINVTDKPLLQEIWVNFILIDEAQVTRYVKPITWYGGLGMNIPPGTHTTLKSVPDTCTPPADFRIGMLMGHVHASTLRITTKMNDSEVLFEDYDWEEPTEWRFNRGTQNAMPDAVAKKSGGYNGVLNVKPGDQFGWECEIQNRGTTNLTFSNRVYDGEMCNVFGMYYTPDRTAANWACAFF